MYKTNIVKTALYLRSPSPHPFPAQPRAPSLTLHARYYMHIYDTLASHYRYTCKIVSQKLSRKEEKRNGSGYRNSRHGVTIN